MTTKLEGTLKRELSIDGNSYTLTLNPEGLHLVPKGKRKGHDLEWKALISGDEAMAVALNASVSGGGNQPIRNRVAAPRSRT